VGTNLFSFYIPLNGILYKPVLSIFYDIFYVQAVKYYSNLNHKNKTTTSLHFSQPTKQVRKVSPYGAFLKGQPYRHRAVTVEHNKADGANGEGVPPFARLSAVFSLGASP